MEDPIEFRINQFQKFHKLLLQNAPRDYVPHYFPCATEQKTPDGKYIASRGANGSWKLPHAILKYDECIEWIKRDGNLALAGMEYDALQPVDCDDDETKTQLKPTLITIGRSRKGGHGWYFKNPLDDRLPANITTEHGECRGCGQYILIPSSFVPCKENEAVGDPYRGFYTVEKEIPATTITFDELPDVFKRKVEEDKRIIEERKNHAKIPYIPQESTRRSRLFDLTIENVVGHYDPKKRFEHPLHDSGTGMNFSVNRGLAHCWRHLVSLNAIQYLVVKSGYMSCDQAGTGHAKTGSPSRVEGDDGAIFYAWLQAKKEGLIPQNDPIPINAILYIARKHEVCDANLIPKRGEFPSKKLPIGAYNKCLDIVERDY
jgi:putative DNA primase/helicase